MLSGRLDEVKEVVVDIGDELDQQDKDLTTLQYH
jgi:hypothetical protein